MVFLVKGVLSVGSSDSDRFLEHYVVLICMMVCFRPLVTDMTLESGRSGDMIGPLRVVWCVRRGRFVPRTGASYRVED